MRSIVSKDFLKFKDTKKYKDRLKELLKSLDLKMLFELQLENPMVKK